MVAYKGLDGLVLCVIEGKINVERWISSIDMLDHSVINYDEIVDSVNNLLNGGLITCKNDKFVLSKTAKEILRGSWSMGCIEWQLAVQKRIQSFTYDETESRTFNLSREEYDAALQKYQEIADKIISRMIKY